MRELTMAADILPNITNINRFLWLGSGLVLMGCVVAASPFFAGDAWALVVGAILLLAGIVKLREGNQGSGRLLTRVLGMITLLAAVIVLGHTILGPGLMTLLLVTYFGADGLWKIIQSFRYMSAPGWLWLLGSGAFSWLLGVLIWSQWPVSGKSAAAILIGANLISTGIALIMFATSLKDTFRNVFSNPQSKRA
jgi:uncharacterized membrane protein HdeD (DUF308 family)